MSTALGSVYVAMVTRLKATAGVVALVGQRVHEGQAPTGTALPYIVVGDPNETRDDAFGGFGVNDTVIAHVFSGGGNTGIMTSQQAFAIVNAMDAALLTPLTLTGWGTALMRPDPFASLNVQVEADGKRHVPRYYRISARAA